MEAYVVIPSPAFRTEQIFFMIRVSQLPDLDIIKVKAAVIIIQSLVR